MGYDVYGLNPKENTKKPKILAKDVWSMDDQEKKKYFEADEKFTNDNPGAYFRNNVWWWRPLWNYVCEVCEDIMSKEDMNAGTGNDGIKISESTVDKMSEKLIAEMALDNHTKFEKEYIKSLNKLPDVECNICDGTGKRKDFNYKANDLNSFLNIKCNGCDGTGIKSNFGKNYPFNAKNVEEFVNFLSESGGIQIC